MFNSKLFFLIGLVACISDQALSLSCKNEQGEDVDWFVLLKPPKQKSEVERLSKGGGYGFITSESKEPGWTLGDEDIDSEKSFTGRTFAEVYENPEKFSYIIYNDAKPKELGHDSSIYAHAKGALVWNDEDAVWIVHSTPKFLPVFHTKKYEFPKTGRTHGQNFFCMTLNTKESVNKILNHIVTMKAQVYGNHISSSLNQITFDEITENINILAKIIKSKKGEPETELEKMTEERIKELTTSLKTKGGETLDAIAKSRKDNVDIWSSIALKAVKAKEFVTKTWTLLQKSISLLSSTCSRTKLYNVLDMHMEFKNRPDITLRWGRNDHSKWGLCKDGGDDCYCAGDMNRATSQFHRGGGVVCMHNKKVHDTFKSSFSTQYSCENVLEDNTLRKSRSENKKKLSKVSDEAIENVKSLYEE